jgi:AcrR family transcriptional regulator
VPESVAAPRSGPGRPSSGADERIVEAALDVLEQVGYAGLTTAKVAARSGHNKALISYHYGSKRGLVAEVARRVSAQFSSELLAEIGEPRTVAELARQLVDALWNYLDRHEGQARVYFDLASQAMIDAELREVVSEFKDNHRLLLAELLAGLDDSPPPGARGAAVVYLAAALEGLALERLDGGRAELIDAACEMFVRSASAALN